MQGTSKPGTFLIELIVVCAALSLIASLVFTKVHFGRHLAFRIELQKMRIFCRFVAQRALFLGTQQTLVIDSAGNRYVSDGYEEKLTSGLTFDILHGAKGPPSDPRTTLSKPCTFEHNTIFFQPDGSCNAGTIYLCSKQNERLYAVTIPVGGYQYIRLYSWRNGSWELIT